THRLAHGVVVPAGAQRPWSTGGGWARPGGCRAGERRARRRRLAPTIRLALTQRLAGPQTRPDERKREASDPSPGVVQGRASDRCRTERRAAGRMTYTRMSAGASLALAPRSGLTGGHALILKGRRDGSVCRWLEKGCVNPARHISE